MAVPAHAVAKALRALPAVGVRIAAVSTDLVAPNAVGGGALIVATGAKQDIAPCFATVKATGAGARSDPANRVRIAGIDLIAANTALPVARLAGLGRVATDTARGLGLCFERVARHESAAVHQRARYVFWLPTLDAQRLRRVVAAAAVGLRMARLAELFARQRRLAVMPDAGRG